MRGFGIMGSDLRECERAVDGCIPLIPRLKKTPLGRARHRQRHCDGNEERWTEVLKLFSPLGIFGGAWRLRRWVFAQFASEGLGFCLFRIVYSYYNSLLKEYMRWVIYCYML